MFNLFPYNDMGANGQGYTVHEESILTLCKNFQSTLL